MSESKLSKVSASNYQYKYHIITYIDSIWSFWSLIHDVLAEEVDTSEIIHKENW